MKSSTGMNSVWPPVKPGNVREFCCVNSFSANLSILIWKFLGGTWLPDPLNSLGHPQESNCSLEKSGESRKFHPFWRLNTLNEGYLTRLSLQDKTISQWKRGASDNCWPFDSTNSLTGWQNRANTMLQFTWPCETKHKRRSYVGV